MSRREPRAGSVTPLLVARSLCLYLLSFTAVAHATIAWPADGVVLGRALPEWAALLAAALVAGQALSPRFAGIDRARRSRWRFVATLAYAGLVGLAIPTTLTLPGLRLLRMEVAAFAALQPAFLLFSGLSRGDRGAVENALVLVVLASLRGGCAAAAGAVGYVALLGLFLAFDRFARALTAYPAPPGGWLGLALRQASTSVLPVAVLLAVLLILFPPAPYAGIGIEAMDPSVREATAAAYRLLAFVALLGSAAVLFFARLLRPGQRAGAATQEIVASVLQGDEPLHAPSAPRRVAYEGARGRIVRAYVSFLAEAGKRGWRRRPDVTAKEFAAELRDPAGPLQALTDLFVRARYGFEEPTQSEAFAAEQAAQATLAGLRPGRAARRPAL